jgi:hypothetical protein
VQPRRAAWVSAFVLTVAGGVLAHALTYEILGAHSGSHAGHAAGGANHWQLCLAVCASVSALGLVAAGVSRLRAGSTLRIPLWIFGILPPAGFALQAHFEWALQPGRGGYVVGLGASILLGVFIQIPFALAAYLAARGLVVLVAAVGSLRRSTRRRLVAAPRLAPSFDVEAALSLFALASGHGQRAPPARLAQP